MLASTIQFTTNTPTPNKQPQTMTIRIGGVRSGALLQNPDSMPSQNPVPLCQKKQSQNIYKTNSLTVLLAVPKQKLLRKEVIQPHLPVRLPCYDFVPIANPTFDHSPQTVRPWASGVTNFRDVTGGVYKARERIHRSVADLRLLATPPSWCRVADTNPN